MTLAHERRGSGPPLVLIHGTGSRWQVWEPVLDLLAAEREAIAVDLPGFGTSPPLPEGARPEVETLCDALEQFWDDLEIERPHVAGNSLGGGIALELARRESVASAVALAPIGFGSRVEDAWCEGSLWASWAMGRAVRPLAPRLLKNPVAKAAMVGQMYARPSRLTAEQAIGDFEGLLSATALHEAIPNVHLYEPPEQQDLNVPVTIAWGTRDRLLFPRQAARARLRLPLVRHVNLEGCGHLPMNDDPDLVARVILGGTVDEP